MKTATNIPPKRRFARRRWLNFLATIFAVGMAIAWVAWLDRSLARTAFATGYFLFGVIVFLAAYQLRKKLPGLPLGTSRDWLRAHLVVAIASGALFFLHIGGRMPDGWLEFALAFCYLATFVSGIWGLFLSRTIPRQLARTGEQFIYERIPQLQWRVHTEARVAVLGAVEETGATTLADFYTDRLHGFFRRPRSMSYFLRPTAATRKRLFSELDGMSRFLTDAERKVSERLFALVRRKDDLDFHASRQGLLKLWLFIHVSLTWSLLAIGTLHGVLALAFRGGPL